MVVPFIIDQNNIRFFRAQLILIEEGRKVLLRILHYRTGGIEHSLKCHEYKLYELKENKVLKNSQLALLYPHPKTEDWDIGLIISLLQNICGVQPPRCSKGSLLEDDVSLGADLLRMRKMRNEMQGHIARAKISENEFDEFQAKISIVLKRLANAIPDSEAFVQEVRTDIDTYLNSPIDQDRQKKLENDMELWKSMSYHGEILVDIQSKVDDIPTIIEETCSKVYKTLHNETVRELQKLLNCEKCSNIHSSNNTDVMDSNVKGEVPTCSTGVQTDLHLKRLQCCSEIIKDQTTHWTLSAEEQTVTLSCGHEYSADALARYLEFIVSHGNDSFRCFEPDCLKAWGIAEVRGIMKWSLVENNFFELELSINYIHKQKDIKDCPKCNLISSRHNEQDLRIHCFGCGFEFCWLCLNQWRTAGQNPCGNDGCEQMNLEHLDLDYVKGREDIKDCPKCHLISCRHSEQDTRICCFGCRFEFCWLCRKEWRTADRQSCGNEDCGNNCPEQLNLAYLKEREDIKDCPNCSMISCRQNEQDIRIHCFGCGFDFCWLCLNTWRTSGSQTCGNQGCEKENTAEQIWDIDSLKEQMDIKGCPNCDLISSRHSDLDTRIRCFGCGFEFCWLCEKEWRTAGAISCGNLGCNYFKF